MAGRVRIHGLTFALLLGIVALLPAAPVTSADATVNWLDPLGYQKPQPVAVNEPNEAAVPNKYWIDLERGAGTTCADTSPCRSFDDVLRKPGTTGGPAVIYVKGTGSMSWFNDTIYGAGSGDCRSASCDNWILVRTWPAGAPGCALECTATITAPSNINSPTGVHHVIVDGGPDLKIRFEANGGEGIYVNHIVADDIIIYRTQMFCSGGARRQLGWAVGDSAVARRVFFINNEFYGCGGTGDQAAAVYVGPGNGGGYADFVFQNNIVRDFFGEGIEINPRVTSSGLTIVGNAIYNVGKGTCNTRWNCRPAITISVQDGGGNNSTLVANNLLWDTGSGCIWDRGEGVPAPLVANNSCFDYGKGGGGGDPNPEGISSYRAGGTAIVRNNILYAPNGTDPLDASPFAASNNVCGPGKSCGPSSATWSVGAVLSIEPNATAFLQIGRASPARDRGFAIAGLMTSYGGQARPQGSAYDIGAYEYGTILYTPANLRIVR
jgi:hypothetical protein